MSSSSLGLASGCLVEKARGVLPNTGGFSQICLPSLHAPMDSPRLTLNRLPQNHIKASQLHPHLTASVHLL